MNYFAYSDVGERYAQARPYLHPEVMVRLAPFVGRVARALDVGAGTGMSSVALLDLAATVVALDPSPEMLAAAVKRPGIAYVQGEAERLPILSGTMPLVTVGLAYHWLDGPRFLGEASRVLAPFGRLVVYNTWFAGRMDADASFASWWTDRYLARYPRPARRSRQVEEGDAGRAELVLAHHQTFETPVTFAPADLIGYLSTHSNVIAALAKGEPLEAVHDWLESSLRPFFREPRASFPFSGEIWIFRRDA